MSIKFVTVALVLCVCGSVAFGIEPIGSPTTSLDKGQWSIGIDFSKTEVDFKLRNTEGTTFFTRSKTRDFEIINTLGKLSHGINNNWEIFFDFGISKSEYREIVSWDDGGNLESVLIDYESDSGFAAKAGTKVTLYEEGPLKLGALFQANWLTLNGDYAEASWTNGTYNDSGIGEFDADIFIFNFAPGASYNIDNILVIYGGPLWQWIDGKGDAEGTTGGLIGECGEGDIKQDSSFGGWIGLQANPDSDLFINIELQATGASKTFGFSVVKKF